MAERPEPRPEVRRAFAEVVPELQLTTAPVEVEARCVGVAFAIFQPTIDTELEEPAAPTPPAPGEPESAALGIAAPTAGAAAAPSDAETAAGDEAAIRDHLQRWESLTPEQFAASWRDLATDPYVGVGPGWVGVIDQATVDQWMKSADLQEAMASHPPFTPRRVTLSNLQVVWLGPSRVVATYRAEETYTNGALAAGNTFAVLMNVRGRGWRIAVASKGTRHEAPLR